MVPQEIQIDVMDGDRLVQRWGCRPGTLPDGSPAAWWRGVLYPLRTSPDQAAWIDVGSSAPELGATPVRHAVLACEGSSWVLVEGTQGALESARTSLLAAGVVISRDGRWLGEAIEGRDYDFFLRCEGRLDGSHVAAWLGTLLAAGAPGARDPSIGGVERRIADLIEEVASLRARLAAAESESRARQELATLVPGALSTVTETAAQPNSPEEVAGAAPAPPTRNSRRSRAEFEEIISVFRPEVKLLRDTLLVATGEFASRVGVMRAIRELPTSGSRPDGWKMLRGADRWWERHVNTGRNDLGRAYARYDTTERCWHLLVSMKGDQAQDVAWLSSLR